jgi:putative endonuclease
MNYYQAAMNQNEKIALGAQGEQLAADFLESSGYQIIDRNKQIGHSDIDIVTKKDGVLVFVEVRTKSNNDHGMPEETLNTHKLRQMKQTAQRYLGIYRYKGPARLDAVCLIINGQGEVQHLKHYVGVG